MKRIALLFLCALTSVASSHAANIIWVSFHPSDDMPSADALAAGFTQAPDIGYTQLLRNAGHTVTRYLTTGTPDTGLLNSADLVIISRSVPSADYETDPETAAWNGLTAPTIVLGGYVLRSNRLGYHTGTTIPDTAGAIRLNVNNSAHPIFSGVALDAGNTMVNTFATSGTNGTILGPNGVAQRGISVNTTPLAGGGTVLATVAAGDLNASGGMIIGEWQAGSVMGTSPADTLGGRRLVFLTGTREQGITSQGAGIYDLTPDGAQLFLNAVGYLAIPEPSTYALIGLGALVFVLRRKKA